MIQAVSLLLATSSLLQVAPPTVVVKPMWTETSLDLWAELREVDPEFKALGEKIATLAKSLEADELESRTQAAAQLKSLGLTAYAAIKSLRDKTPSAAVQAELDAVLKSIGGDFDQSLALLPGARRLDAKAVEALKGRLKEKKALLQQPFMALHDGQRGSMFLGDARPLAAKVRTIIIEGDGTAARLESQGPVIKTGMTIDLTPKIDGAKGTVTLEIKASARSIIGLEATEVTVRVTPTLASKEGFLAGPFPAADEKGAPWWLFITECQAIP